MRPVCYLFGRININISMAFAFLTFGLVKKEIWIVVSLLTIQILHKLCNLAFESNVLLRVHHLFPPLAIGQFILRPLIKKSGAHKRQSAGEGHPATGKQLRQEQNGVTSDANETQPKKVQ